MPEFIKELHLSGKEQIVEVSESVGVAVVLERGEGKNKKRGKVSFGHFSDYLTEIPALYFERYLLAKLSILIHS